MKTAWAETRLQRLYQRYNRRYWNGKLPRYSVEIRKPEAQWRWVGFCDSKQRTILIDISAHESDQAVRGSLLHEMAHAAVGEKERIAHGYRFWGELERLLRLRAPISVGLPEAPAHQVLVGIVPKRFPLARRAMEKLEVRRQRKLDRKVARDNLPVHEISDEEIVLELSEPQEAAAQTWTTMLWSTGARYGLIDVGGRPMSRWADRILKKAKKAHRRERRDFLEGEKLQRLSFDFMHEYRTRHPETLKFKLKELYAAYTDWCRQRKERPLSLRAFCRYFRMLLRARKETQ